MPTYFATRHFECEYKKLTAAERRIFLSVLRRFIEDVKKGRFRRSLRVKRYRGQENVYEMTWAGNGRALFMYGREVRPGEPHIIWLRIGGHEIL
jgi:hypothetical protein